MSNQDLSTLFTKLAAAFSVLTTIIGFFAYHFSQKVTKEKESQEALAESLEPMISKDSRQIFGKGIVDGMRMRIGNSSGLIIFSDENGNYVKLFDENVFNVVVENDTIKVSMLIRDSTGDVIAELNRNDWEVNPKAMFKRNYSKNALEVIDNQGRVVFHIIFNVNEIQFEGVLYGKDGKGIAFLEEGKGGLIYGFDSTNRTVFNIKPIFRYPSSKYLGVRIR